MIGGLAGIWKKKSVCNVASVALCVSMSSYRNSGADLVGFVLNRSFPTIPFLVSKYWKLLYTIYAVPVVCVAFFITGAAIRICYSLTHGFFLYCTRGTEVGLDNMYFAVELAYGNLRGVICIIRTIVHLYLGVWRPSWTVHALGYFVCFTFV